MSRLRYYIPDFGHTFMDSMSVGHISEPGSAAEAAAQSIFDGTNAHLFPLKVCITDDASADLGTFDVELRAVPEFNARQLKDVAQERPKQEEG